METPCVITSMLQPLDSQLILNDDEDLICQTSAFNVIFPHTAVNCVLKEKTSNMNKSSWVLNPYNEDFYWHLTF